MSDLCWGDVASNSSHEKIIRYKVFVILFKYSKDNLK